MSKFIFNPWFLLALTVALVGSHALAYNKGYGKGEAAEQTAQAEAEEEASNIAANEIDKTKQEAQIVYKYIRETPDNNLRCPITYSVIERLPGPQPASSR